MSTSILDRLSIKIGIGERIRTARAALGLKQVELAEVGGVSRATQISYETGVTEPTTAYLRSIQASGIDIPLVLFGHSSAELDSQAKNDGHIDWDRLQRAHDDVEFFCQRVAPACPSRYRWLMVADLYSRDVGLGSPQSDETPHSPKDTMNFLSQALANYV